MERRRFLKGLAAVVGGVALEQAIPLGRVWSFPKRVETPDKLLGSLKFHQAAFVLIDRPPFLIPRIDVLYGFANLPPDALFHPEPEIVEAYRRGEIGRVGYYSLDES